MRTTERILECTVSAAVAVQCVNNYWNTKDNVLCIHECTVEGALVFVTEFVTKKRSFTPRRNEYVPMTRKIITTIIWMQRESNETEFHFDFEHLIKQIRPIARLLNCPRTACALPSVVITLDIEQCFPLNATFISLHSLKGIGSTSLSKMKHFSFN